MPTLPVTTVNGNTIPLSTQSEGAKLYYSTTYNVYFGNAQRNYTEYTDPIEFDRNIIFTPRCGLGFKQNLRRNAQRLFDYRKAVHSFDRCKVIHL